jgi:hypothetical protein
MRRGVEREGMRLTCNIDERGRAVRRAGGLAVLIIGVTLLGLWAVPTGGVCAWLGSCTLLAVGAFCVFEAWAGWCALRAMGMKTKL